MTQQTINRGTAPNDKTGDTLYTAFGKVNENFTELYNKAAADVTDRLVNGTHELVLEVVQGMPSVTFPAGPNAVIGVQSSEIAASPRPGDTNEVPLVLSSVNGDVWVSPNAQGPRPIWKFKPDGSLEVPVPEGGIFTLTLSAGNYVPTQIKPTLTLTSAPWVLHGEIQRNADGTAVLMLDNIFPILVNPGYESGDTFAFDDQVHQLYGYTLTIGLADVVLPGGAGWTANLEASQLPAYPRSLTSIGALSLHGRSSVLVSTGESIHEEEFKFIGRTLQIPQGGDITRFDGTNIVSVLGGNSGSAFALPPNTTFNDLYEDGGATIFNNGGAIELYSNVANGNDAVRFRVKGDGGDNTFTFKSDGSLTFPDTLSISGSIIGRRTEVINGEAIDAHGARLNITDTTINIEAYNDPDGLNNIGRGRVYAVNNSAGIETIIEDVSGETFSRAAVLGNGFEISQGDGIISNTWTFSGGILTIPGGGDIVDSTGETVLGFASTTTSLVFVQGSNQNGITIAGNATGTFSSGQVIKFSSIAADEFVIDAVTYDGGFNLTTITLVGGLGGPVDGDEIFFEEHGVTEIYPGDNIALGIVQGDTGKVLTIAAVVPTTTSQLTNNSGFIQLSAVPQHSYGTPGDVAGMIAINGGYIYSCVQNYVPNTISLITNDHPPEGAYYGISQLLGTKVWYNGPIDGLQVGETFTHNAVIYTIQEISNTPDIYATITFSPHMDAPTMATVPAGTELLISTGIPLPDIWKRVSFNVDTW